MTSTEGTDASADEERWLVVHGRRWRRTDPALPTEMIDALTSHLGRGRSAIRVATRAADADAVAVARRRVDTAKRGLGERGPAWWDRPVEERLASARTALRALDDMDSGNESLP